MRVKTLLVTAVLTACLAAPAAAISFDFDLTGSRNASFSIDSSRAPDRTGTFQTFFDDTVGIYNFTPGVGDISFANFSFGPPGGFEVIAMSFGSLQSQFSSSEVLFTGTLAAPVFKTGTFALTSIVAGNSTLTITTSPSFIPEPATWALLLTGFGLVGTALRRRNRQVVAA